MEELHFLKDLVVVYGVGCLVVYVFHRLRQSPVVGFLLTGVLVGPHGLSLIDDAITVETLAELGVMILLFSLGLEFSLKKLMQLRRVVLGTGPIQVGATVAVAIIIMQWLDFPLRFGFFVGFLLALSSTAIVLRMLIERAEMDSIHGRAALGILIFQDLCVVPMIVVTPLLVSEGPVLVPLARALLMAVLVIVGVVFTARYLFPWMLERIVRTRSQELFTITAVVMLLGTAWITAQAGFSLVLGAFLAGLVLSESEYSHQVFVNIRPLQNSLNSLFFISIGMLVNPAYILSQGPLILLVVSALLIGKAVLITVAVLASGLTTRTALMVGLPLAQIGEFSFVLLEVGSNVGLISGELYPLVIASMVATMILTPGLFWTAGNLVNRTRLGSWGGLWGVDQRPEALQREAAQISDHVIVCGFGVSGASVATVLKANSIPYLILELNPQTVSRERSKGEPIFYGDCTQPGVLEHAGIDRARVIVLVLSDPFSSRRAVAVARNLNERIAILTRTKYLAEIVELSDLGADEVVAEEFESSIELIWRIMRQYNIPRDLIRGELHQIRAENYTIFLEQHQTIPRLRLGKDLDIYSESVEIGEGCPLTGQTLLQAALRKTTGTFVLGILREGQTIQNPGPADTILAGDVLVLIGTKNQLKRAMELLSGT